MTTPLQAPSIFESFNAKVLEPEQLARIFVTPKRPFAQLAKRSNALVVGPRGSGKTTLLKMLQPQALDAWIGDEAQLYRKSIDFVGVFVGTDRAWGAQLQALAHGLSTEYGQSLIRAAFTSQVMRCVVETMQYLSSPKRTIDGEVPFRQAIINDTAHRELVYELNLLLKLQSTTQRLRSVKFALDRRTADIKGLWSVIGTKSENYRKDMVEQAQWLTHNYADVVPAAIEIFNELAGWGHVHWAVLCDELELAPDWLRVELTSHLRSIDRRLLYKLSFSPYAGDLPSHQSAVDPQPSQDFEEVLLWHTHKEDGYPFCEQLLARMLAERGLPPKRSSELFGVSSLQPVEVEADSRSAYSPQQPAQRLITALAAGDPSFAEYLRERQIDPWKLHELSEEHRAEYVRKVTPLVALREAYRVPEPKRLKIKRKARPRKAVKLYTGADALFAVVEGNPRWFTGIVGRLLDQEGGTRMIPRSVQFDHIDAAVHKYRALLRTIPCPPERAMMRPKGILAVVDPIGKYLHREVVFASFNPDPPGSFTVDSNASEEIIQSLGTALNAGAIVYVPDAESAAVINSLRGKRFRLTYLLAPFFGTPLRLGRSVSLRHILGQRPGIQISLLFPKE